MTWKRAGFARIRRAVDCAGWLEAQADESLADIRLHWIWWVTRRRRRVTHQIRRLARVFVITFARNQVGRRAGFLLEFLSFPRIAIVNDGATGPWFTRGFAVY